MLKPYTKLFIVVLIAAVNCAKAQLPHFTEADSLRGNLTTLRTCYDIRYYHLDVKFDTDKKYISGSNLFRFTATQDFKTLQFDLFANLLVDSVEYHGKKLSYTRKFNAVFLNFPDEILKAKNDEFVVYYSGYPTIAKNAPWDGGVVFSKDSTGKPWAATACEGIGASIWYPNKDHQYDEVDSMLISISVPNGLKDVSNGRLRKVTDLKNGYIRFDWFVSNPINNYDVTANIGDYVPIADTYYGEKETLDLNYWVMPYDKDKALRHLSANVKPMLKAYEHWFGAYPFYEDSYKLIETPYLAMEHQSGISYGNHFKNGYDGQDITGTGLGYKFDYSIIHESAHEWFGNSITAKDMADLWIHEAFACYAESLFVEDEYGKVAAQEYLKGLRRIIQNDTACVGYYNVNKMGSTDMYAKGAQLLNMIRATINNDAKWMGILHGLNKAFYHKTVTYNDIVNYINQQSGINFSPVFDQYLHFKQIPILEYSFKNGKLYCRWIANTPAFNMPVKVKISGQPDRFIKLTTQFTSIDVKGASKDNFSIDDSYYIGRLIN